MSYLYGFLNKKVQYKKEWYPSNCRPIIGVAIFSIYLAHGV